MIWPTLFGFASVLIVHSYVLFPTQMVRLGKNKAQVPSKNDATVDVIMAAYNEADIIEEKVHSVFKTNYPASKIRMLIGSDASNDGTDALLERLADQYPGRLIWQRFHQRTGKPPIINQLVEESNADILVITDADALFHPNTLVELVAPFSNDSIGGVQANAHIRITENDEVAQQEASYTPEKCKSKPVKDSGDASLADLVLLMHCADHCFGRFLQDL